MDSGVFKKQPSTTPQSPDNYKQQTRSIQKKANDERGVSREESGERREERGKRRGEKGEEQVRWEEGGEAAWLQIDAMPHPLRLETARQ